MVYVHNKQYHWLCLTVISAKGEFDSDFEPSGGSKGICIQILGSSVAKRAYLLHSHVGLNLTVLLMTNVHLRHSPLKRDFVVTLNYRYYE